MIMEQSEECSLVHQQLECIPEIINQFCSLRRLRLDFNEISEIDDNFNLYENHTTLLDLSLFSNRLQRLSPNLFLCNNLVSLNLGQNRLKELPNAFGRLTALKCLNLQDNLLETLPSSLTNLMQLKTVNLCNNRISRVHWSLVRMRTLWEIDLRGNLFANSEELAVRVKCREHENFRAMMLLRLLSFTFFDEHVKDAIYSLLMIHSFRPECEMIWMLPKFVVTKICLHVLETKDEPIWDEIKWIWWKERPECHLIHEKIRMGLYYHQRKEEFIYRGKGCKCLRMSFLTMVPFYFKFWFCIDKDGRDRDSDIYYHEDEDED